MFYFLGVYLYLLDIVDFYKQEERRKDTILILFSDHGARTGATGDFRNTLQGRLEEYMPFYSIILPSSFKNEHKDFYANIKANTEVLTSHFDVHMTLKHILSYPELPVKGTYGQSLFTKINPKTRTCNQTGIPERYCFCSKTEKISKTSTEALSVTQKAVDFINSKLASTDEVRLLCAELKLKTIIDIERSLNESESEEVFVMMFRVSPSDASFDMRIKRNLKTKEVTVDTEISRTNLYGDQPACIQLKHPKLAPFCYCKSLL